jgi:predicted signal transduction protein with EAL and GGDEF domain
MTSLTTALRSYEQIRTIALSRHGLEKIVAATADLFERRALESLAEGVLIQIAGLLGFSPNGLVCAQRGYPLDPSDPEHLYVVGAIGPYAAAINRPLEELGNSHIEALIRRSMEDKRSVYAEGCSVLHLKSPGGSEEAIYLESGAPLDDLDRQLVEVFASNISIGFANVYLFTHLNHLAYYDTLTNLPNRHRLLNIIDSYWRKSGDGYQVYLIDIDHFADINDVHGEAVGDALIRVVADRLQLSFPDAELARYGGDVFCLVAATGSVSGEAIQACFREPFELPDCRLPISITLGLCQGRYLMPAADALMRAGLALTEGKRGARGSLVAYNDALVEASRARMELTQALRLAVRQRQLALYYQPQLDLASGRVVGVEALLRWTRPDGQSVSPAVFIPLAERSDLINTIGDWVIGEACRQLAEWRRDGLENLRMAINISAQQVRLGDCVATLSEAMRQHALTGRDVEIEVTESMVLGDAEGAVRCLRGFSDLGVSIALDDFGTGFSSLSYLHRLPINTLKIDREFVSEIGAPGQGEQIAEMVVALGRILKLHVLAEGIETEAQAATLLRWGCVDAQGFLYAPAMPAPAFVAWLRARQPAS